MAQYGPQERILSFQSLIEVHSDATLTVSETIRIFAAGNKIKHGIFRDFPTIYSNRLGTRQRVTFDLISVSRDGNPSEPYHTGLLSNGIRVYIGEKTSTVPHGEHTYTLTYETKRQIGFFKDFDELYWNVTGNDWEFPIDEVTATVQLPPGAGVLETDGYTGFFGAKGTDFTTTVDFLNRPVFKTTRGLSPNEGLTIVVSWPKGFVPEPTNLERSQNFLEDNLANMIGLGGFLLVLFYYLMAWHKLGKDPQKGTIIPLFHPPDDRSPAALRYLTRMGFDDKALSATIVQLAVKGALKISSDPGGQYSLERSENGTTDLREEERDLLKILFQNHATIELKQKNYQTVQSAIKHLQSHLRAQYETLYFVLNREFFFYGLLLSMLTLALCVLTLPQGSKETALFMSVWLTGWTCGVFFLLLMAFGAWKAVFTGSGKLGAAIAATLFAGPFVIGEIAGTYALASASLPVLILLFLLVGLNLLFYHLMKAPTLLGRSVMDKIEGFKLFLSVTERDRLKMLSAPKKTPELFERYLPYAIALDVEEQWSDQFTDVLQKASQDGEYHPGWYHGYHGRHFGAAGLGSALGSGLSHAVSSSSTAPGSHSGGHGGGHSGGGGGGGGGGGW